MQIHAATLVSLYTSPLLKGIIDGFLTPYKVQNIKTLFDQEHEYIYQPGDTVLEGEIEKGRPYTSKDFNRKIIIEEEERVKSLLQAMDQLRKPLFLCYPTTCLAH